MDVPPGDPAAFEAARIEAGVPAMGREITDKTIPQEAGALVEHAVSFTKGCYTGQELVARLDARGNNVARRLRGVVLPPAATKAGPGIGARLRRARDRPTDERGMVATVLRTGRPRLLEAATWSPLRLPPWRRTTARREIRELPLSIG